ncbi:Trm112 family protein [Streptomyces sp. ST2-7A]|uniref:Trm112 family protein n=1 Tax=Streptomyces sp. ST2-7A TaxID=2907214 RepID=UPI001F401017|nr:Trm112 family protein [Streptomyces sp. ST2-7A]MCE7083274.1 Trm112 family protein [Streptomyces sp. ST2-7A]
MSLVDAGLLDLLACPACHAPLREDGTAGEAGELVCTSDTCRLAYPVRDGIPILLVDEAEAREAS